jgi:hypothetical protein
MDRMKVVAASLAVLALAGCADDPASARSPWDTRADRSASTGNPLADALGGLLGGGGGLGSVLGGGSGSSGSASEDRRYREEMARLEDEQRRLDAERRDTDRRYGRRY